VNTDELNKKCPQFAILPGGTAAFQAHLSRVNCVPMDTGVLSALATSAVRTGSLVSGYQKGTGGELVRVRAEPLFNRGGKYIGAVVAVADARPEQDRHDNLVLIVIGGCVVL